jgi:hypothetical protein
MSAILAVVWPKTAFREKKSRTKKKAFFERKVLRLTKNTSSTQLFIGILKSKFKRQRPPGPPRSQNAGF